MIYIKSVVYCNVALDKLFPTHEPATQIKYEKLLWDVKEKGFADPLLVHRKNNRNDVMIGNARYAVAETLGYESVPCIVVNFDDSEPLRGTKVTKANVANLFNSEGPVDLLFTYSPHCTDDEGFIIQARKPGGWVARY